MSPNFWKMSFGRILNKLRPHVKQPELRQTLCLHRRRSMRCTLAELEVLHLCLYCVCLGVESGHIYLAESVDLWKKKKSRSENPGCSKLWSFFFFVTWSTSLCLSTLNAQISIPEVLVTFCFLAENLLGALLRIKEVIRRRVESSEDEDTDERGMTQRLEDILRESSGERKKFRPSCAWQKISDQIFRSFWIRRSKVKIQTLDFPSCCNCIWLRLFFFQLYLSFLYRTVFGVGLCFSFFFLPNILNLFLCQPQGL